MASLTPGPGWNLPLLLKDVGPVLHCDKEIRSAVRREVRLGLRVVPLIADAIDVVACFYEHARFDALFRQWIAACGFEVEMFEPFHPGREAPVRIRGVGDSVCE